MNPNPILGVLFHWLGGLASGSFYVPFRGVKRWSWETSWLVAGVFSWLVAPWFFAMLNTKDVVDVLKETSGSTWGYTYLFGALWGLGGLTFGLTMRYLGMSLGMAVALGYCTVFGTLIPPIFKGEFAAKLLNTPTGQWSLAGLAVCVVGIVVTSLAGKAKEAEMSVEEKQNTVKEFNFKKGILVATFSGIMSACFSFGLSAGKEIGDISKAHGTAEIWTGLPVLIVVLLGGFSTNFIWCVLLNLRNRTGYEYLASEQRHPAHGKDQSIIENVTDAPAVEMAEQARRGDAGNDRRIPMVTNYLFAALAGVTWYFQFFFYSMGETQMGDSKYISWTLHMASIIIFSSIWGLALREWKGASQKSKGLLFAGLGILVLSTVIIGVGNYIGRTGAGH
ncbi:MAG: L-rhamnose/proton symporter RhaT [Luteolibacter sp.]